MQYNLKTLFMNTLLDPIVNFGKATVSTGYSSTDTTIVLHTDDGAKLPDPSIAGSFNLVWFNNTDYSDPADDPNVEIVRCISRVTDTLVLMRGQEGTSSSIKNIPGKIYKIILSQTKKTIGDIQTDAQSRVDTHSSLATGVHGVGGDSIDAVGARNTAISSHAAITSSIHNFDSSGNTPPQLHGKIKHDSTTVDGGASLGSTSQIPLHGSAQHTGIIGTEGEITFTSAGGHTHDGISSTRVPWVDIDKTISNITDITTKSHTSLTDIGTNTHSQIDTHISSYTNIHGISAGLDASKPAFPTVGQRYIAVDTNKDYECYIAGTWRDVTATHAALTVSVHGFDALGNAPPQVHGLASHTGIIGDHAANLTSVGTNSHAQIDSHIVANSGVHGVGTDSVDGITARNTAISTHAALTSSVHNFDTSGNAPPQTHGNTRHDSSTVDGGAALSSTNQIPAHGSSRHTGTIGTWGQIDKTTSSIADINTRSHSSLTDGAIPGTTNNHATIDTAITNSTSHIAATTGIHGTTGNLVATGASVSGQYNSAKYTITSSLLPTADWSNGNVQYIVLQNGTSTFAFANPRDGSRYMLILKQPSSGSGLVTWPSSVSWSGGTAPTLTTTNNYFDIITFVYDATNTKYWAGSSLNYH